MRPRYLMTICLFILVPAHAEESGEPITQDIGVTASGYKYVEDDVMSLKGPLLGVDYAVNFPIAHSWFIKGNLRYEGGKVDYESNGTGSAENQTTWYLEPRLLAGYTFSFGAHALSPYAGFGFRFLYHDGRGTTSTGRIGYRRESRYFYLPLGLSHRWALGERKGLTSTIEYDYLVKGRQTTEMGDVYEGTTTPGGTTLVSVDAAQNDQRHGHGWRASVMMQLGDWSFGPYFGYWRLADSDVDYIHAVDDLGDTWVFTRALYEPKNKTTEAGIKLFYSF